MEEPTDRALRLQGLRRAEYDSLSKEGKTVIASRSRRTTEISDITLAAELLNSLADSDEPNRAYIREALEGKHPSFAQGIRQIIDDYIDSDVETSIRDFYKIRFGGKKGLISASIERELVGDDLREANTPAAGPQAVAEQKPPTQANPEVGPPIEALTTEPVISVPKPPTPSERIHSIAVILSRWEKRDTEGIMRTEADVIGQIMTISDENNALGLTDEGVCKAAEAMITNGTNGMQYYTEALLPANRELLLQTAKAFIR